MPLAVVLGRGDPLLLGVAEESPIVDPRHVAMIGQRDVDPGEADRIRRIAIRVHTMKELDERGFAVCMKEALERVAGDTAGFHLSFDMDALDPAVAPGVGTPVPGGLTYREAHLACELVAETRKLVSMDVVECNPILDERNRTAALAVELILSALGKTIL
jgi:arginase